MRQVFNSGQEIVFGDFNSLQGRNQRLYLDRVISELLQNKSDGFFKDGMKVTFLNSTSFLVNNGFGFMEEDTGLEESVKKPIYLESDTQININTPDVSNPRIDILCIKWDLVDEESGSRKFKDEFSESISTQNFVVSKKYTVDLNYVAGVAAGSPVAPAVPAGYLKVAEIAVAASTGIANADSITDFRSLLPVLSSDNELGTKEWDAVVGDTSLVGVNYANLKLAMDNASAGWKILVLEDQTVDDIHIVSVDNLHIELKRGVKMVKGSAITAFQVDADNFKLENGYFQDFDTSGDKAIVVSGSANNSNLGFPWFVNCDVAIEDLGTLTHIYGEQTPKNLYKVGDKDSINDKGIEFETNEGANNKKLVVKSADKSLNYNGNTFNLGDGATGNNKFLIVDPASGAGFKWNGSGTSLEFSNDGLFYKKIGSGAGGRLSDYYGLDAEDSDLTDWNNSNARFAPSISNSGIRDSKSYNLVASSALIGDYIDLPTRSFDGLDLASVLNFISGCVTGAGFEDDCIEVVLMQNGNEVTSSKGLIKAGQKKIISPYHTLHVGSPFAIRFIIRKPITTSLLLDKIEFKNHDFFNGGGDVNMHVIANSTDSEVIPSGVDTPVTFNNELKDSKGNHNALNGRIDITESGDYSINAYKQFVATAWTADDFLRMFVRLNGTTEILRLSSQEIDSTKSMEMTAKGYGEYPLEAGDYIEICIFHDRTGGSISSFGQGSRNHLSVKRVGDYGSSTSLGGEILSEIDYRGNGGQSITAGVTDIPFATPFNIDRLGEWDGSGFVAKTTKTYIFSGAALFTTALNSDLNSYIDTVFDRTVNTAHGIAEQGKNFICIVKLKAGERWSLRSGASGTLTNNSNVHYINVNALAETSNGIAPEQVKVYGKYNSTTSQSFVNNSPHAFENTEYDSHGMMNLAGTEITLPKTAKYRLYAHIFTNPISAAINQSILTRVELNSVQGSYLGCFRFQYTGTMSVNALGGTTIDGKKGDVLRIIQVDSVAGAITTQSGLPDLNFFTIEEV